jgi:hypothetical protein
VVAVGSYNLATDQFTAGISSYWSTLVASANDATAIAAYVSGRLLSYVLSNGARLLAATPTSRTLWVLGGGQTPAGQAGNFSRPFATVQAAHDADVIHVLPGGTGVDALGRRYYPQDMGIYKNVTVVCAPGVSIDGVQIGAFAGYYPYRIGWQGEKLRGALLPGGSSSPPSLN